MNAFIGLDATVIRKMKMVKDKNIDGLDSFPYSTKKHLLELATANKRATVVNDMGKFLEVKFSAKEQFTIPKEITFETNKQKGKKVKPMKKSTFKIGQVYSFDYESTSNRPSRELNDPVYATMDVDFYEKLSAHLTDNAKTIEDMFKDFKAILKREGFFKVLDSIEKMDAARKERGARARKDDNQKALEQQLADMKERFFNRNKETEDTAEKHIIRSFKEEGIKNIGSGSMAAIYAGKFLTSNGHEMMKWYVVGPVKLEREIAEQFGFTIVKEED